jgi:putative membrane protein
MGAADVIPGVSGGTVAFLSGIYEEIIYSFAAFDRKALGMLLKFRIADFWKKINGNFLTAILAGVITSALLLSKVVNYLLLKQTILFLAFFFGCILIAAPLVLREVRFWRTGNTIALLLGIGFAYGLTLVTPFQSPDAYWVVFVAGVITICAMTFPGISGAFILLLIGKYQLIINAIVGGDVVVMVIFALGCLLGIIYFSRVFVWLFENSHGITIALLTGFMLGSLNKVWPWREVLEYATNRKGAQIPAFDKSILPWDYLSKTGKDPLIFQAILMMALGIFLVVLIEKVAERLKTKH